MAFLVNVICICLYNLALCVSCMLICITPTSRNGIVPIVLSINNKSKSNQEVELNLNSATKGTVQFDTSKAAC